MTRKTLTLMLAAFTSSTSALAAPTYVANFAAPAALERVVSSDRLWACEGSTCLAGGEATSPARHICTRLAKEVGVVTAFSFRGHAFAVDDLAACNTRAGHSLTPAAAK